MQSSAVLDLLKSQDENLELILKIWLKENLHIIGKDDIDFMKSEKKIKTF